MQNKFSSLFKVSSQKKKMSLQVSGDIADNVFGKPINDAALKAPSWRPTPRLELAREAFNVKNTEDKDLQAIKYVERLRAEYGNGISTLCSFYNATGGPLKFVYCYDWEGHIWRSSYPTEVENGMWGAFLHVHTSGAMLGSSGLAVYRGKNHAGVENDWMISWSNPWKRAIGRKVYAETRPVGHFQTGQNVLNIVNDLLKKADTTWNQEWGGCVSEMSISDYTTPVVLEAILTLKGVDQP